MGIAAAENSVLYDFPAPSIGVAYRWAMEITKNRIIKLAAVIPVALVCTLAASVADVRLSTGAVAAPATAADVQPERLKGALLTVDQLPEGYRSMPLGDLGSVDVGAM